MTKRDYERLAKALRAFRKAQRASAELTFEDIVDQIALACRERGYGGMFDYTKFRDACYRED